MKLYIISFSQFLFIASCNWQHTCACTCIPDTMLLTYVHVRVRVHVHVHVYTLWVEFQVLHVHVHVCTRWVKEFKVYMHMYMYVSHCGSYLAEQCHTLRIASLFGLCMYAALAGIYMHVFGRVHPRKMCCGLALVPIIMSVTWLMQSVHVCEHYTLCHYSTTLYYSSVLPRDNWCTLYMDCMYSQEREGF